MGLWTTSTTRALAYIQRSKVLYSLEEYAPQFPRDSSKAAVGTCWDGGFGRQVMFPRNTVYPQAETNETFSLFSDALLAMLFYLCLVLWSKIPIISKRTKYISRSFNFWSVFYHTKYPWHLRQSHPWRKFLGCLRPCLAFWKLNVWFSFKYWKYIIKDHIYHMSS